MRPTICKSQKLGPSVPGSAKHHCPAIRPPQRMNIQGVVPRTFCLNPTLLRSPLCWDPGKQQIQSHDDFECCPHVPRTFDSMVQMLENASAMQIIPFIPWAPNVVSRPILRKTLTLQPCLNQSSLSHVFCTATSPNTSRCKGSLARLRRGFTQLMTQQNAFSFLLKIHKIHILTTSGFFNNTKISSNFYMILKCKPFDHHPVRSLAHYPKGGEEGLKSQTPSYSNLRYSHNHLPPNFCEFRPKS